MGFSAMEVNQSLYIFRSGKTIIAIWVHVDDGVFTSNSATAMLDFKCQLCSEVDIKWQDIISQIVVKRDSPLPVLPQPSYATKVDVLDTTTFRLVVGSLAYLVSSSHPDLAFAVNYMAPTEVHWIMLDHVVGYLLKTHNHRLRLRPGKVSLNLWSDAGWGGDLKRLQTGFMLKLGNTPILWCSKRQGAVAPSTCAVEYVALSDSTQNLVQAICQLTHLTNNFDNQAAVQVSIENLSRKQMR
ncbi:hypothetical protein O181_127571 [Austropuccinia psidii MF-1]|uniref:Reverse transcriptase Ty1/copia-type domain-containing protein n=1 Tax=Austropuccinia psidii MF-1 TaxID=1389203 RepID=A0A9Q3Q6X4_9BASI|nr:hypothetical protein [Austropuccinia psidii MF-1]